MKNLSLAILIILSISILCCGCNRETDIYDIIDNSEPDVEAIVSKVITELNSVNSYQEEIRLTQNMNYESKDEVSLLDIKEQSTRLFNIVNKRFWLESKIEYTESGIDYEHYKFLMEIYRIGNDTYIRVQNENENTPWGKIEESIGSWQALESMHHASNLLQNGEINLIGIEKINDKDCYIITVIPDKESIISKIMSENMNVFREDMLEPIVNNCSVKYWIDNETHLISKQEIKLEGTLTPSNYFDQNFIDAEAECDVSTYLISTFDNYNYDMIIELPPEAKDAEQWESIWQFGKYLYNE